MRAKSLGYLGAIANKSFALTLCGIIDIYKSISNMSHSVQKVKIFGSSFLCQNEIADLKGMAAQLDCLNTKVRTGDSISVLGYWQVLSRNLDDICKGEFKEVELKQDPTKDLRSRDDFGGINGLVTI